MLLNISIKRVKHFNVKTKNTINKNIIKVKIFKCET